MREIDCLLALEFDYFSFSFIQFLDFKNKLRLASISLILSRLRIKFSADLQNSLAGGLSHFFFVLLILKILNSKTSYLNTGISHEEKLKSSHCSP